MVNHTVGRALDLFDIDVGVAHRWGEQEDSRRRPAAKRET
jgi:4-hydroxy-3-polyprenylbenzoate decarboxylase